MRFNLLKATEPLGGGSLLFTSKFQIFMVLIWSTSGGLKAESALESTSDFELRTPGLGIQRFKER